MHEYNYLYRLTTTNGNGTGLFAGEIELNTCCMAMVKLRERVVELSTVAVLLTGPNLHLPLILVLPLIKWTGCGTGVQPLVARQN